ncbi:MFS transporter [Sphingomonas yunnanensis]|uniref:MFS transporter n=1 Tax=Sphingomonas yunnanensis TaxID=310400 RepID=UPI001CA7572E|nr:MFS transporter [Sphingomonas yunnanensis]MBY9062516.1 MFS transporter [Sphingomonas yunnanensis]
MSHSLPDGDGRVAKLPLPALLALALTGFLCIATETLPAGLLPQMTSDLDLSPALAGQTVTAYALGSLMTAIPLTLATATWPRRRALLLTVAGFLLFNSVTALSSNIAIILVARFLAGCAAGLAWSLIAAYARRMVVSSLQGKAVAVAMIGTPIALSIGVPLGTWLGSSFGWRHAFTIMSAIAAVLAIWILCVVPSFPGQPRGQRPALLRTLLHPGVRPILLVVLAWMLGHNIIYTYIAPLVAQAGLGERVDLVLLVFGVASLGGIWLSSRLVDRALRHTVIVSLAVFTLVALGFAVAAKSPAWVIAGVAIWGLSFGGAATLLQTALADAAGAGAEIALSMNVVAWNLAIAGGSVTGGLLLEWAGVSSFPYAVAVLVMLALSIALRSVEHGFPVGPRPSADRVAAH